MDTRLSDILNGQEENYILPFYWQHGADPDRIPEQIQTIYNSGCRALCVESRPHPDFAGPLWWRDMDIIISECKLRGMKVWILDDDHFPTGHANGLIKKKYPQLRQWELIERHLDVVGPLMGASVLVDPCDEENILLGVYAYRRNSDEKQTCEYKGIDLSDKIKDNLLFWDVPEGVYRIFFYYRSRKGGRKEYIDMISSESVDVLIEAVYEPHYEHYKDEFGKTIAGFFSDEPCFGNGLAPDHSTNPGMYEYRVGTAGLTLPWNERVYNMMKKSLGHDPLPELNLLWFEDCENGDRQAEVRFAYMDAITALYNECFTEKLANWCHEHKVEYIGHVIEDMNGHSRTGACAGHYFRALSCQDMSGIDIVLHQVMPGMEDYIHTAINSHFIFDGVFFHNVLGKLAASLAHLFPHMKKRAMCEVFGAFGWAEDSAFMKWLIDFLLVRGINHFVPHAFSFDFPDPDCPPHFGSGGQDPSFEAFEWLMKYTNKAAHILCGATHKANAALLYHAEGEWSSRYKSAMTMDKPAKNLYDRHIDFDIIPMDILEKAKVENRKLVISDESFDFLLVPYADHMPSKLLEILSFLTDSGLPVWYVDALPENAKSGETVKLDNIADKATEYGFTDVTVVGDYPKLRIYHCERNGNDIFMFFNEGVGAVDTKADVHCVGDYARLDLVSDEMFADRTSDGLVSIDLLPGQSQIFVFGEAENLKPAVRIENTVILKPEYTLELATSENMSNYKYYGKFDSFFNVEERIPGFAGKMKYVFSFNAEEGKYLDFGSVGQNVELSLNGTDLGMRICAPYRFDISKSFKKGENRVEAVVSNTLVGRLRDSLSKIMLIKPSGILGDIKLLY